VDVELPDDLNVTIRRGLMVVAKIIQNLANNIFFGKEAHMVSLNPFLKENITNVTRFLSELSVRFRSPFLVFIDWLILIGEKEILTEINDNGRRERSMAGDDFR